MRRRAMVAVLDEGMRQGEAARLFGVHPNTVSKWVRAARAGGRGSLAAGRRGRRPGEQLALTARQQAVIVRLIRGKNPDQLRLPFALWTREAVRDLIEQRYGLRLGFAPSATTCAAGASRRRSRSSAPMSATRPRSSGGCASSIRACAPARNGKE